MFSQEPSVSGAVRLRSVDELYASVPRPDAAGRAWMALRICCGPVGADPTMNVYIALTERRHTSTVQELHMLHI